jgi:hypothetical protein
MLEFVPSTTLLYPPSLPHSFNRYHFCTYIHVYTFFPPYSPPYLLFPPLSLPQLVPTSPHYRTCFALLFSSFVEEKRKINNILACLR